MREPPKTLGWSRSYSKDGTASVAWHAIVLREGKTVALCSGRINVREGAHKQDKLPDAHASVCGLCRQSLLSFRRAK